MRERSEVERGSKEGEDQRRERRGVRGVEKGDEGRRQRREGGRGAMEEEAR